MSETMIDYASTVYNALNRAMEGHPYAAVRMHPDTAVLVRRAASYYQHATPANTPPLLLGLVLIVDDSVEPGQFRFEYEVAAMLREG